MSSRTRILTLVKGLRWRELGSELRDRPDLVSYRDPRGRNLLHLCCCVNVEKHKLREADSVRTADVLLEQGIDINAPASTEGEWQATPLWFAIASGDNLPLARHLLERGADPGHCLWAAVNRDNAQAIHLLVASGADDPTNEEGSPLLAAIEWNKSAAAEALLKVGADPNFRSRDGMTPLHCALRKRRDEKLLRMLIEYGARGDVEDGQGITAIELMARRRDPEIREMAAALSVGS